MNIAEVAEELGLTPGGIRNAIARGRMQVIRKGGGKERAGFLLVERTEVERYRNEVLGKRGVASPDHPLHGLGRQKKRVLNHDSHSDAPEPSGSKSDTE